MRGSDLFRAKALVLAAVGALAARWAASEAGGGIPFAAAFGGAMLLTFGVAALYEGAGYGVGWLVARIRRALGGGPDDRPGSGSGAPREAPTVDEEGEDGGPDAVDQETDRPAERAVFGVQAALVTFFAYVAGNAAVWILLGIVVGATAPPGSDFETLFIQRAPGYVVWSALAGAFAAVVAFRVLSPVPMRALPGVVGRGPWRTVLIGVAIGALANAAYLRLVPLLPVQPTRMPDSVLWEMLTAGGATRWTVLATAVLVAPFAEELVFRGFVLEGLSRRMGPASGIVGAGLLFTVLHVPDTAHYWPATVMIFVMGVVAGVVRVRTGYLGPAVGVHFGHNAVVAVLWAL